MTLRLEQKYQLGEKRVVSDMSRFEFGTGTPRNRSRNPTPTSIDVESTVGPRDNLEEHDPEYPVDRTYYEYRNELYQHYMKPSLSSDHNNAFVPYPTLLNNDDKVLLPYNNNPAVKLPSLPSFQTLHMDQSNDTLCSNASSAPSKVSKQLPPIVDKDDDIIPKQQDSGSVYSAKTDLQSLTSRKKDLERDLIKKVMNRPVASFPVRTVVGTNRYEEKQITITANFILYVFEIIIAVIIITLCSILAQRDNKLSSSIYRYLIADGVVSLIVSFLFITTIINFEKRNGSFYCLVSSLMTFVSFIIAIAVLIPKENCSSSSICTMRKVAAGFIIISFCLWLSNIVMLLTTYYISNLNLLQDINFDYSSKGLDDTYNLPPTPMHPSKYTGLTDPNSNGTLREYFLNEDGEMYEIQDQAQKIGRDKIIVYI